MVDLARQYALSLHFFCRTDYSISIDIGLTV